MGQRRCWREPNRICYGSVASLDEVPGATGKRRGENQQQLARSRSAEERRVYCLFIFKILSRGLDSTGDDTEVARWSLTHLKRRIHLYPSISIAGLGAHNNAGKVLKYPSLTIILHCHSKHSLMSMGIIAIPRAGLCASCVTRFQAGPNQLG